MQDDKTESQLLNLPQELILLIASFLDEGNLLNFRQASKLLERITQHLFFNVANKMLASDTIACGVSSIILARSNSHLLSWSGNWIKSIALGDYSPFQTDQLTSFAPKKEDLKNVIKVAMGYDFFFAMMKDGTVFSSGANNYGELGLGDKDVHIVPKEVPILKNATQIAAGLGFVLAILEDGTLSSWGRNTWGQLGHGHQEDCLTPKVIPGIKNVDKIAVGDNFSVALTKDGTLYIWGRLGLEFKHEYLLTPKSVITLENVASISAGRDFIVALKNDGTVFTYGSDHLGKLGVGIKLPNLKNVIKISVNNNFSDNSCLALTNEGAVYFWDSLKKTPEEITTFWDSSTNTPQEAITSKKIVDIGQGVNFLVALGKNGMLYIWNSNCHREYSTYYTPEGMMRMTWKTHHPKKIWSLGEPTKTKFFDSVTKRLVKERFAKTLLMPEQKASLREELTFFDLTKEGQFEKEIRELEGIIKDESSASATQIEDKIDSCLKIYSSAENSPKKSLQFNLFVMKQQLYAEKAKIVKEIEAEVSGHIMKRS